MKKDKRSWKITFGMYKGRDYHNIPSNYLNWILTLDNFLSEDNINKVNEVLLQRKMFAIFKKNEFAEKRKNAKQ